MNYKDYLNLLPSSSKAKYTCLDEAHRFKSTDAILYKALESEYKLLNMVMLTGSPIQNNLQELYSLLHLCLPKIFTSAEQFHQTFPAKDGKPTGEVLNQLKEVMKPIFLRRLKDVVLDLPSKNRVVVPVPLTTIQKNVYKAVLTKDAGKIEGMATSRLLNVVAQLRKASCHPYLFDGVEPEPFVEGEHLVEASAKLKALDVILKDLKKNGRKALVFSQMTSFIDILQDYCHLRDYPYERLDGSARSEERNAAVTTFQNDKDSFVFLLSTRAGGLGLNLVAADTVIFTDLDWNPTADLQAEDRAYRLGQTKDVTVIRLISRDTIDEVILRRAMAKMALSNAVLDGTAATDTLKSGDKIYCVTYVASTSDEVRSALKFGLSSLVSDQDSDFPKDRDILSMLKKNKISDEELKNQNTDKVDAYLTARSNLYHFDGVSQVKSKDADDKIMAEMQAAAIAKVPDLLPKRKTTTSTNTNQLAGALAAKPRKKAPAKPKITAEERLKLKWQKEGYKSVALDLESDVSESDKTAGESDEETAGSSDEEGADVIPQNPTCLNFTIGDVSQPVRLPAVVCHTVDASGDWGRGGIFSVIKNKWPEVVEGYEKAHKMKDLKPGFCLLLPTKNSQIHVALLAAHRKRTVIDPSLLGEALARLSKAAKTKNLSVHMPRIGDKMPGFNWYSTERLIRSRLVQKNVNVTVYYFRHNKKPSVVTHPRQAPSTVVLDNEDDESTASDSDDAAPTPALVPVKKNFFESESEDEDVGFSISPKRAPKTFFESESDDEPQTNTPAPPSAPKKSFFESDSEDLDEQNETESDEASENNTPLPPRRNRPTRAAAVSSNLATFAILENESESEEDLSINAISEPEETEKDLTEVSDKEPVAPTQRLKRPAPEEAETESDSDLETKATPAPLPKPVKVPQLNSFNHVEYQESPQLQGEVAIVVMQDLDAKQKATRMLSAMGCTVVNFPISDVSICITDDPNQPEMTSLKSMLPKSAVIHPPDFLVQNWSKSSNAPSTSRKKLRV